MTLLINAHRIGVFTQNLLAAMLFLTAPASAASAPVKSDHLSTLRFIVSGDSRGSDNGVNSTIWSEIVQTTLTESVDFILMPGDLVTGSLDAATLESQLLYWRTLTQPLYDAGIGVYPCRGNHDFGSIDAWNNVFANSYALPTNGPPGEENLTFAFAHGNTLILGLDQLVNWNRVNQPWLDTHLDTTTADHIFVFGHMPAFKVDHTDCLDDFPADRDLFWHSLDSAGARAYFCGHDHFYDHARIADGDSDATEDLHQMLVGTAGAPLRDGEPYDGANGLWTPMNVHFEKQYGYVLVEIEGPRATFTWKHRTAPGVYESGGDQWSYTVPTSGCCAGDTLRGDADSNCDPACITVSDLTYLIAYIFRSGPAPTCAAEADTDASGTVNVADLTFLIAFLFRDGPSLYPCP